VNPGKAGHLRVACRPGFATSHLPDTIAKFMAERPGVTVTLVPDRPERILEWIIGEQYDCGIAAACERVARRVGVSIISELDAAAYATRGLSYRPIAPAIPIPHKPSLVRPVHKYPSMITPEFMELFREGLRAVDQG
jgi:DNA-binding transcriptional LysR family regulator